VLWNPYSLTIDSYSAAKKFFLEKMPPGKSYSAQLAPMALKMATSMKNIVVETFKYRCLQYLEHCLRAEIQVIKGI
jgi:hypothetical protein